MKVSEFWTQAFLASLHRVTPAEAQKEANEATNLCVEHWKRLQHHVPVLKRAHEHELSEIRSDYTLTDDYTPVTNSSNTDSHEG